MAPDVIQFGPHGGRLANYIIEAFATAGRFAELAHGLCTMHSEINADLFALIEG
jgi:hypothetical protein